MRSTMTARVWPVPAGMLAMPDSAFAVFAGSSTFTGTDEVVVELCPSRPELF